MPKHYQTGNIECIDYLESVMSDDEFIGFLKGNVIKYLHRYKHKNGLDDLIKGKDYYDRLIKKVQTIPLGYQSRSTGTNFYVDNTPTYS